MFHGGDHSKKVILCPFFGPFKDAVFASLAANVLLGSTACFFSFSSVDSLSPCAENADMQVSNSRTYNIIDA